MELTDIYAPVSRELVKVEQKLKSLGEVDFPHLAELVNYSLTSTGKMLRPALTFLSGTFFDYEKNVDLIVGTASGIEVMHIATLVHDDAIDHSDTRRGRTTVYKLWGEEQAVLLGDYLFAVAGQMIADTGNLRVVRKFSSTLETISHGEINQAHNSYNLNQTRDDYYERISRKTAALFLMSTEAGAVLSGAPENSIRALMDFAFNLGIGFQIVDDILDFVGTEEQLGKPVGSDLKQGTLTLPSFMILEKYPGDNPVKKLFENRGGQAEIDKAVEIIKNSTIVQECYDVARQYCEKASKALQPLPPVQSRDCLEEMTNYVMRRNR